MHLLSRVRVVVLGLASALKSGALTTILFVASVVGSDTTQAGALKPGDIVVVTQSGGRVYVVDPTSGSVSKVSSGNLLHDPSHVLIDRQGLVLTAERTEMRGGIRRIDPATGEQSSITKAYVGSSLAFLSDSELLVGGGYGDLARVDIATGAKTAVTTLDLWGLQDVDVDQLGRYVVLDFGNIGLSDGKIVRYDPITKASTIIAENLNSPVDLAIRASGEYVVSVNYLGKTQILVIDPATSNTKVALTVPSHGFIALEDDNTVLFADFEGKLSIMRGNLSTGETETLSTFQFVPPNFVTGIAVYHPVPEPSGFVMSVVAAIMIVGMFVRLRGAAGTLAAKQQC